MKRSLLGELKRRNVFKAAVLYIGVSWALSQGAAQLLPVFDVPNWGIRWFIAAAVVGFPFWIVLAWFFELTPEGLKLERDVAPGESITRVTGRRLDFWIIGVLAVTVVLLVTDRFVLHHGVNEDASTVSAQSIAVLPFVNMSTDKDQEYIADGISQELLNLLAKIPQLRVIARTSSFSFKGKDVNVATIAKALGVTHVLEGSVRKAGDKIRITAQLVRAADSGQLWSETYDRKLDNIFDVESEVATAIASALQAKLTSSEQSALAIKPTDNAAAYDAYLRGLVLEDNDGLLGSIHRATAAFDDAVRLDPRFALAWAHLSINRGGLYFNGDDTAESAAEAVKQAADTALRLQPGLGEAWLAQGDYRYHVQHDLPGALQAFDEASKRLPNNSHVLAEIAFVLRRMGRWDEALSTMQRVMQLDPRNRGVLLQLALEFLSPMRRFAEARAVLDLALLVTPDDAQLVANNKGWMYAYEGRLDEAAKLLGLLPLVPKDDVSFEDKANLLWGQDYLERRAAGSFALQKTGEPLTREQAGLAVDVGFAQLQVGGAAAARPVFERVIHLLEPVPASAMRSDNTGWPMTLASAYAGIGDEQTALETARRALESYRDDAVMKTRAEITLAQIQAWFGDSDTAVTALPHLLQVPNGINPVDLWVDTRWGPLRKDPRVQRLLADSEKSKAANL